METVDTALDTITFYLDEIADKAEVLDKAEKDAIMSCVQRMMWLVDSEEVNYTELCDAARELVTNGGYLGTRDWKMTNQIFAVHRLVLALESYAEGVEEYSEVE